MLSGNGGVTFTGGATAEISGSSNFSLSGGVVAERVKLNGSNYSITGIEGEGGSSEPLIGLIE